MSNGPYISDQGGVACSPWLPQSRHRLLSNTTRNPRPGVAESVIVAPDPHEQRHPRTRAIASSDASVFECCWSGAQARSATKSHPYAPTRVAADQGYGRGGTPGFNPEVWPRARVARYLTPRRRLISRRHETVRMLKNA